MDSCIKPTCWYPRLELESFVRVKHEKPYIKPSAVFGRVASVSQVSPSIGPHIRIRKECVCEPSSKCAESGNEENALQSGGFRFRLCCKHRHRRPTDIFWASACVNLSGGYMLVIFGPISRSKSTKLELLSDTHLAYAEYHSPVTRLRTHLRSFAILSVPIKSPSKLSCVLCIRLGSLERVFERDTRLWGFDMRLLPSTSGSGLSTRSGEDDALSCPFIMLALDGIPKPNKGWLPAPRIRGIAQRRGLGGDWDSERFMSPMSASGRSSATMVGAVWTERVIDEPPAARILQTRAVGG